MRYRLAVAAVPMLLSGCASLQMPYSEVTGERYHFAIVHRQAVDIVTIGGKSPWVSNAPYKVDPGTYRVVVESRHHHGFSGRQVAFELNIEPCKRYYLNAQFPSNLAADYVPVVDEVEPIAGCRLGS